MMDPIHRLVQMTSANVGTFALLADDFNPIHMNDEAARAAGFEGRICHGGLFTAIISGMIATAYPGAIWMEHEIQFKRPALVGQTLDFGLSLEETIRKPTKTLGVLIAEVRNPAGDVVAKSRNVVLLPARLSADADHTSEQPADSADKELVSQPAGR
jgi:acyl dehydratase